MKLGSEMQNRSFPLGEGDGGWGQFKSCLEKENWEYLKELIEGANKIKRIIK